MIHCESHLWRDDHSTINLGRATRIDPVSGVQVYVDTGDPVYNYPYTPPKPGQQVCTACASTRIAPGWETT